MNPNQRVLQIENLETRALMAADASFDSRTGALKITGSNAADNVQVNVITPNQVDVWVNQRLLRLKPNAIRSIQVDLAAGNDYFEINGVAKNSLNVRSIDVKLGSGVNEKVALNLGSVGRVNVDAVASRATSVSLNTVVTDRLFVDMGSDSEVSADTIHLIAADINRFDARMGGGDDRVEVLSSSVRTANVTMGAGNDKFITSGATGHIDSGTIDGGSGQDTIDPLFKNRARRFERVWAW